MLMLRAIVLSLVIAAALAAAEVCLGVVVLLMVLVPLCALGFAVEAVVLGRIDHRGDA